jgi:hypothetical protein
MDARVKPAHDSLAVERRRFQTAARPAKLAGIQTRLSSSKGHTP